MVRDANNVYIKRNYLISLKPIHQIKFIFYPKTSEKYGIHAYTIIKTKPISKIMTFLKSEASWSDSVEENFTITITISNINTITYIGNIAGIAKVKIVSVILLKISSVFLSGANNRKVKPSNINKNLSRPTFFIKMLITYCSFM